MVEIELSVQFHSSQIMGNLGGFRQHEPVAQKFQNFAEKPDWLRLIGEFQHCLAIFGAK